MTMNISAQMKLFVVGVLAIVSTTGTQVAAAKVVKPDMPLILKVSPVSITGKYAKVRVLIEKTQAKVTRTVVNDGFGAQCTITAPATSCTISKVQTKYPMRLAAVSWAGNVRGKRTGFLGINAKSTWIRDGYNFDGVKYPAATNAGSLVRLLGTSTKWSKFQALKRSGISSAGLHQARPRVDGTSIVFQVSGIVGLAMASSTTSCGIGGSNGIPATSTCAVGVGSDGTVTSIFAPGSATATVSNFYSAPNGKFYVTFMSPTSLTAGGVKCAFAEVDSDTGIPTCVDSEIFSVTMGFGYSFGAFFNGNSPVQFDSSGAVYYAGSVNTGGMSQFTLRKYLNGSITKLVSDNIYMRDYVVLGDGTVLIAGMTTSTQVNWLRKLTPGTNSVTSLVSGSMVTFLRLFVDGNVYWGVGSGGPDSKVSRYLSKEGRVDEVPWMAGGNSYSSVSSRNDMSGVCPTPMGPSTSYDSFCQSSGSLVRGTYNMGSDRTVALSGVLGGVTSTTRFVQYYPTVQKYTTIVSYVTIALQVGKKMILTGTDASGKNVLTIFDTDTFQESVLLDGSNEFEIYSIGYVPSTNKVMFNGLNFANNQYQVGDITLP